MKHAYVGIVPGRHNSKETAYSYQGPDQFTVEQLQTMLANAQRAYDRAVKAGKHPDRIKDALAVLNARKGELQRRLASEKGST